MTTNQTIDGVPRKSLEQALKLAAVFDDGGDGADAESARGVVWILRALLDAPETVSGKLPPIGRQAMWQTIDEALTGTVEPMLRGDVCNILASLLVPAAQPQGEPVACMPVERCYEVRAKMIIAFNEAKKAGGDLDDALDAAYKSALRYSPNPLSAEQADRSPEAYAIEHAEYMAKSADNVLAKFQAYGLALLAVDEGGDDGEGELFENIDSARGDLQESLVDLRSMVYEFRKRAAKFR